MPGRLRRCLAAGGEIPGVSHSVLVFAQSFPGPAGLRPGLYRGEGAGLEEERRGEQASLQPRLALSALAVFSISVGFFFFPLFFRFWICFGAASRREKQGANIRASPGGWKTTKPPPWGQGHPRSTGQGKVRGVQGTSGWQHRFWHRCRRDAEPLLAFWTPVATCPSSSPPALPLSTLSLVPNPTPVIYACEKDLAWGSGERWLCPSL